MSTGLAGSSCGPSCHVAVEAQSSQADFHEDLQQHHLKDLKRASFEATLHGSNGKKGRLEALRLRSRCPAGLAGKLSSTDFIILQSSVAGLQKAFQQNSNAYTYRLLQWYIGYIYYPCMFFDLIVYGTLTATYT